MRRKNSAVTFIPSLVPLMQECQAYGRKASVCSLSFKNRRMKLDICAAHNQLISEQIRLFMPSLGVSSLDFDRVVQTTRSFLFRPCCTYSAASGRPVK